MFFETSRKAALREAILGICRLTLGDKESIDFKMLLNYVENHPQIMMPSKEKCKELVNTNRARLMSLQPFIQSLRPIRDRELAHLDRKHLNDPSAIIPKPIIVKDLARSVDVLSLILSDIWQALNGEPLPESQDDVMILKELEMLWKMIEENTEKVEQSG
jgi:hypothetical protein